MIKQDSFILVWMEGLSFAADKIDLRIEAGEYIAVSGIFGTEKINFISILGCLNRPRIGKYIFDYNDIMTIETDRLHKIRGNSIGFIFKGLNVIDYLTVYKNIEIPLLSSDCLDKDEKVIKAADKLGLKEILHKKASDLSDFERHKMSLARALVVEPMLIIADEPGENLSKEESALILDCLRDINAEGVAVIAFSDSEEVIERATRHITFEKGKIKSDRRLTKYGSKEGAV